jgi:hypothetical protein
MAQAMPPLDVLNDSTDSQRPDESASKRAVIAGAIGNFVE